MKTALVFGITGQDGGYLAEFLLEKGYRVIGVSRRVSVPNDERIRHLYENERFSVVNGDVTDAGSVRRIIDEEWGYYAGDHWDDDPLEVYNLSAMSFVKTSFDEPCHSTDVTYKGCLNILEAVRSIERRRPGGVRLYQASSSEMFGSSSSLCYEGEWGDVREEYATVAVAERSPCCSDSCRPFQDEQTSMLPNSPYAIAKLAAHHAVRLYRESYGLFACSGILFNHESPRRSPEFVTRKITKYVRRLANARWLGETIEPLRLGNLDARRDWGYAGDYVKAMWLMLQQDEPDDYVVATGQTHTVYDFLVEAFAQIGIPECDAKRHFVIDPAFYRPCEVPYLRGDASRAKAKLGWEPEVDFKGLVKKMVESEC